MTSRTRRTAGREPSLPVQAWRFASGMRSFAGEPMDPAASLSVVAAERADRSRRFLAAADAQIWSQRSSPHRALLRHAGVEAASLRRLVEGHGLDEALRLLLDDGVYLSYEEAQGAVPVRRGSLELTVDPMDLANPLHRADFIAGTSGTRSGGTPVPTSFPSLRRMGRAVTLIDATWDVTGSPHALWLPALPSSAGLVTALADTVAGSAPSAWFSPTDPADAAVSFRKRAANRLLPLIARTAGTRLSAPRLTPVEDPGPVLAWCTDALGSRGSAVLHTYASAAVGLSRRAREDGVALDGLVVRMIGEPVTPAKAEAVRACGAQPVNVYAFAQLGLAGTACPRTDDEHVHLFEHESAVVTRRRTRSDGEEVDALAWTTLSPDSRIVLLNTENDDQGTLSTTACDCLLGRMGMSATALGVRGITKSVAAGVTVPGDMLQRVVDHILPATFGGEAGQWQFVETDGPDGTRLELRADPAIGPIEEPAVREVLFDALRRTDAGALAAGMWSEPGMLRVTRARPASTPVGKVLAYHVDRSC